MIFVVTHKAITYLSETFPKRKPEKLNWELLTRRVTTKKKVTNNTSDEESMEDELEDIDEDSSSQDESEAEICILL